MNRLVLIGNGFDLAHGLKTSYADFIDWYWEEWGKRLLSGSGKFLADRFCSFKLNDSIQSADWFYVWIYQYPIRHQIKPGDEREILKIAQQNSVLCEYTMSSPLFETICKRFDKGWVDIEDIYYAFLKSSDAPKHINDDLEFIKDKLVEYLSSLQDVPVNHQIKDQILGLIEKEDVAIGSMDKWDDVSFPDNIMLLNFNYTNTADKYLPKLDKYTVNHIHGTISNPESIIFGYGDEKDEEYDVLMKKNDNEYLRHIKSFRYLDTSNYRRMLAFIESAPYQLCIMGHSCGVSDRTLLSTLFEHPNCVSIKPYYHQIDENTDDYRKLVQNIARNFKDPSMMRARVVGKERCEPLGKVRKGHNNYAS